MADQPITFSSSIDGVINGTAFTATGQGQWDPERGVADSTVTFSNDIPNFLVVMCGTWSCKNHNKLVAGENPFNDIVAAGHTIGSVLRIRYPIRNDEIVATGIVHRPTATTQEVKQTRIGNYSGPTDVARHLPFTEYFTPDGPGRAIGRSARYVEFESGLTYPIYYEWFYSFSEQFELPSMFVVNYEPEISWDADNLQMSLSFGLGGGPNANIRR